MTPTIPPLSKKSAPAYLAVVLAIYLGELRVQVADLHTDIANVSARLALVERALGVAENAAVGAANVGFSRLVERVPAGVGSESTRGHVGATSTVVESERVER